METCLAVALFAIVWLASGALATRYGIRHGLIPPGEESIAFYLHGAAIGPFAWWAVEVLNPRPRIPRGRPTPAERGPV